MNPEEIATPAEILATYTDILRHGKPSEQLKAGENLAKYLPMTELAERPQNDQAILDLIDMVDQMTDKPLPPLD